MYVSTSSNGNKFVSVRCSLCRAKGPEYIGSCDQDYDLNELKDLAIEAWNKRAADRDMMIGAQMNYVISAPLSRKKLEAILQATERQSDEDIEENTDNYQIDSPE